MQITHNTMFSDYLMYASLFLLSDMHDLILYGIFAISQVNNFFVRVLVHKDIVCTYVTDSVGL